MYVNVLDSNDPPNAVDMTINLPENSPAGYQVALIVVTDPEDDELRYSMQFGDTRRFSLAADGRLQVVPNADTLDFEGPDNRFTILYRAADSDDPTVFSEGFLTIVLTNVNEPPALVSDPIYVIDETFYDFDVTLGDDVRVADPDAGDTATFSVGGASTLGLFTVDSTGRVHATQTAGSRNFDSIDAFEQDGRRLKAKDTLTITARDQGGQSSVSELTLYVTANITTDDPIITGVLLVDGSSGSGGAGGGEGDVVIGGPLSDLRLQTLGGQVLQFYGSNVFVREQDPWAVVTARAEDGAGASSGLSYAVMCRY